MTKRQRDFLVIFKKNMCLVATSCEKAGISRKTFYDWKERHEDFAKAVEDANESMMDFGESKLLKLIQDGDTSATIFYAKTKLRNRGYQENRAVQADLTSGGRSLKALTDEQLDAEIERLGKICDAAAIR